MKKYLLLIILIILIFPQTGIFPQSVIDSSLFKRLYGTHDLSLPDWGPYTKRYIGISHIPDKNSGIRFDLSVFPGFYRRKVMVPNVLFESDYHPWEASPNLEYFSFRHELEWKDHVYTDISYSKVSEKSRLIRIECVNNTDDNQNLALHFMASINFPPYKEYSPYTFLYPGILKMPEGGKWINALDYKELKFLKTRPQDNLVPDGKMRAEIRDNGLVNSSGIGQGFGLDKGDFVSYDITVDRDYKDAVLYVRYRLNENEKASFNFSGLINRDVTFEGTKGLGSSVIKIGSLKEGSYNLVLKSNGLDSVDINGFAIIESNLVNGIEVTQKEWNPVPQIISGPVKNSLILKYDDADVYYGLLWQYDLFEIRQWNERDLADYFKQMVNEHVKMVFDGEGKGHYTNVFLNPVVLSPKSKKEIYGIVCCGTKEEVFDYLNKMSTQGESFEKYYTEAHKKVEHQPVNPDGEKYTFSIERMKATLACNVVYPVYTQKQYIRHSTPGRWWDCLYTWDSGFIGLGLLQMDTIRAIESLNTYTQEPGAQSAFIHHGSPVPVQHYLFFELWNKTQSKEMLEYFYPRLKQYHEFMAGNLGSSTTRVLKSNILKTWDYFYNSGGWDDLPPQKYTHDQNLETTVAPVITTAQVIRTAKILKMAAGYLGKKDDIKEYDRDIKMFGNALQKYSWDEKSGYFGYVVHDTSGNPLHILKYKDSVNYDMGFDGAYPLIAGICTKEEKEKLLGFIESNKHIWSSTGLSAVDQSAPYYRVDGYWNGTVWLSHQWFFWKTMLDLGEDDFAYKIAKTGLDVWKNEVEESYNCMEHFLIETGRGAGWHEFGGLSSPVLLWYSAYFCPGNFTTGFDVWIENKQFSNNNSKFSADIKFYDDNNNKASFVACMNPAYTYSVRWNGKAASYKYLANGTLSITVPVGKTNRGKLEIIKK